MALPEPGHVVRIRQRADGSFVVVTYGTLDNEPTSGGRMLRGVVIETVRMAKSNGPDIGRLTVRLDVRLPYGRIVEVFCGELAPLPE